MRGCATGARRAVQQIAGLAALLAATGLTGVVMYKLIHGPSCTVNHYPSEPKMLCGPEQDPRGWLLVLGFLCAWAGVALAGDASGPLLATWLAAWGIGPLIAALDPHISSTSRLIGWILGGLLGVIALFVLYVWVREVLRKLLPERTVEGS